MLTDADTILRNNATVMAEFDAAMARMQALVNDLAAPAPAQRTPAVQQDPPPEDPADYTDDEQAEELFSMRAIDWLVSAAVVLGLGWLAGAGY